LRGIGEPHTLSLYTICNNRGFIKELKTEIETEATSEKVWGILTNFKKSRCRIAKLNVMQPNTPIQPTKNVLAFRSEKESSRF